MNLLHQKNRSKKVDKIQNCTKKIFGKIVGLYAEYDAENRLTVSCCTRFNLKERAPVFSSVPVTLIKSESSVKIQKNTQKIQKKSGIFQENSHPSRRGLRVRRDAWYVTV
jgi:hypothetical protein